MLRRRTDLVRSRTATPSVILTRGELHVLVSTTVVEVGVDVPNAAVMLVENAECFGLSQLHQLRGRVGRGKHKSYCILMSDSKSEKSRSRLKIMTETNDGFEIANADLAQRGPAILTENRQARWQETSMQALCSTI